jgi:hypothetical protein
MEVPPEEGSSKKHTRRPPYVGHFHDDVSPTNDTKQRCQLVGTPSTKCCSKSKSSPRGNSGFNIELSGNSRKSSYRSSSSNLQNNFLVLCPQLHRVVVKHKV